MHALGVFAVVTVAALVVNALGCNVVGAVGAWG